jgi:hypothetical protein
MMPTSIEVASSRSTRQAQSFEAETCPGDLTNGRTSPVDASEAVLVAIYFGVLRW